MKKEIEIVVPKAWGGVTLKEYLDMSKDLKAYEDNEEAMTAVMFHRLCKVPVEWISKLDIESYIKIKNKLTSFLSNTELPLQKLITIDGIEYGFEPNLSNMSYGAYVDITKYNELTINDNWADIMSILYRPVINKVGKLYDIKEYDGKLNPTLFLSVGMDVHFGALFFLQILYKDLLKGIVNYLMEEVETQPSIKSILEKSGVLTPQ
jgi:hypothetical protein